MENEEKKLNFCLLNGSQEGFLQLPKSDTVGELLRNINITNS